MRNGAALSAAHHNLKAKTKIVKEFGITKDWTPQHPNWDTTVETLAARKIERFLEYKGEVLNEAKAQKGQDSYLLNIVKALNLPSKEAALDAEYDDVFASYASEEEIMADIDDLW